MSSTKTSKRQKVERESDTTDEDLPMATAPPSSSEGDLTAPPSSSEGEEVTPLAATAPSEQTTEDDEGGDLTCSLFQLAARALYSTDLEAVPLILRPYVEKIWKEYTLRRALRQRYDEIRKGERWANNYFHPLTNTCCSEIDYGGCNCMCGGCSCKGDFVRALRGPVRYDLKKVSRREFHALKKEKGWGRYENAEEGYLSDQDPHYGPNPVFADDYDEEKWEGARDEWTDEDFERYYDEEWEDWKFPNFPNIGFHDDDVGPISHESNVCYCERCYFKLLNGKWSYPDPEFMAQWRLKKEHAEDSDTEEKAERKYLWRQGWDDYERVEIPPLAESIVQFFTSNLTTEFFGPPRHYGPGFFSGIGEFAYTHKAFANVPEDELAEVIAYALSRPDCKIEVYNTFTVDVGDCMFDALRLNTSLKRVLMHFYDDPSDGEKLKRALRENADSRLELIAVTSDLVRVPDTSNANGWVRQDHKWLDDAGLPEAAREGRGKGGIELEVVKITYEDNFDWKGPLNSLGKDGAKKIGS